MVYDVLIYLQQAQEIARKHKASKDYSTPEEFLSRWNKNDKLIPCYTIVIYWGEKPWDGPRTLSDMVQFKPGDEMECFKDYPMELLCVNELTDLKFQNEDVYKLFTAVNALYKTGGGRLPEILSDVNVEVAYTASIITGTTKQYSKLIEDAMKERKGSVNMCEAVERVLKQKREEGQKEGRYELISGMFCAGISFEQVVASVEGKVSESELRKIQEQVLKKGDAANNLRDI